MTDPPRILLAGSKGGELAQVASLAEAEGIEVHEAKSALEALKTLAGRSFDLILTQARLDDASGLKLIRRARSLPSPPDILVAGPPVSRRREAEIMAEGVTEYLELPSSPGELWSRTERVLAARRMALETGLIGRSHRMLQIFETIRQVAATKITVLIVGESGTGKEIAARAIHRLSERNHGPFVAVNCGAIPEGLLESELFGHEKGAFTGASERHPGRFEQADRGTLFLDEIGETPSSIQVKLLRALEDEAFYRVGGRQPLHSDVRLVAATNRDLEEAVAEGSFRRDLYFRLRVVTLALPPLRDRLEDVPLLVDRFLSEAAERHGGARKSISPDALDLLLKNDWPGNVRELRNLIESSFVLVKGDRIEADDLGPRLSVRTEVHGNLPVSVRTTKAEAEREIIYRTLLATRSELAELRSIIEQALHGAPVEADASTPRSGDAGTLTEAENRMIAEALQKTGGNRRRAAEILGISERTLYRRLQKQRERETEKP